MNGDLPLKHPLQAFCLIALISVISACTGVATRDTPAPVVITIPTPTITPTPGPACDATAADPNTGTGTVLSPYLICTAVQLYSMAQNNFSNGSDATHVVYYLLKSDIDLTAFDWVDNGISINYVDFDGNGYTISNLNVSPRVGHQNGSPTGIFHAIQNGSVHHLEIKDSVINGHGLCGLLAATVNPNTSYRDIFDQITITNAKINCSDNSGALFGNVISNATNSVSLTNIQVTGSIASLYSHAGGVAGTYTTGTSVASAFDHISFNGSVISVNNYAGGLFGVLSAAGVNSDLSFTHISVAGDIINITSKYASGLFGYAQINTSNAYLYNLSQITLTGNYGNQEGITTAYDSTIGNLDTGSFVVSGLNDTGVLTPAAIAFDQNNSGTTHTDGTTITPNISLETPGSEQITILAVTPIFTNQVVYNDGVGCSIGETLNNATSACAIHMTLSSKRDGSNAIYNADLNEIIRVQYNDLTSGNTYNAYTSIQFLME